MSMFGAPLKRNASPFGASKPPLVSVIQVPPTQTTPSFVRTQDSAFPSSRGTVAPTTSFRSQNPAKENYLFGKRSGPVFEVPEEDLETRPVSAPDVSTSLPFGMNANSDFESHADEWAFPFSASRGSPTSQSFTIPASPLFGGRSPTLFEEHGVSFGPRIRRGSSFAASPNHIGSSGYQQSSNSHYSAHKSFASGSSSGFHSESSYSTSPRGYDALSFMASQMPSLGLWRYLQSEDPSTQSHNFGYSIRPIPHSLRVIFGLHCSKHAPSIPASPISGGTSPTAEHGRSSYGAQSLEGVWKLVNFMSSESTTTPVEAFKQFPKGLPFSIAPSNSSLPDPPLQRRFRGTGAITNDLADTLCSSLGVRELLGELNKVLGTEYELDADIDTLLHSYVEDPSVDFGRAYGELRRGWFCDPGRLKSRLENGKREDEHIRQQAIDPQRGLIVHPRIPPRRVWDLYSNRVLPFWVLLSTDIPRNLWAVSHAWVELKDRQHVPTRINGGEWPVPIPNDIDLEQVRIELLNLGAEYVWLDVLCLRQKVRGDVKLENPLSPEEEWLERLRGEEWRLDVPTIGHVYRCKPSQVVITYFSGLGRPFSVGKTTLDESRAWLNRVWTMQETTPNWLLGGLTLQPFDEHDDGVSDVVSQFHKRMCDLLGSLAVEIPDIFALITFLSSRKGTHDIDFIGALGYLLKCPAIPIYDEGQSVEDAWDLLLQQLDSKHLTDLLVMYPEAGQADGRKWRPSWHQLNQLCPERTLPITYSQRDLLQYIPRDQADRGPAYSNYGYVIEKCFLVDMSEGGEVVMRVPIGRLGAKGRPAENFRVQPLGHRYDSFEAYGAVGVADLEYWVLGKILHRGHSEMTFEKVAVFRIPDPRERERLWHLNPGFSDTKISYI